MSPDMVVVESLQAFLGLEWSQGANTGRQRDAMLKIESCRIDGLWDADYLGLCSYDSAFYTAFLEWDLSIG